MGKSARFISSRPSRSRARSFTIGASLPPSERSQAHLRAPRGKRGSSSLGCWLVWLYTMGWRYRFVAEEGFAQHLTLVAVGAEPQRLGGARWPEAARPAARGRLGLVCPAARGFVPGCTSPGGWIVRGGTEKRAYREYPSCAAGLNLSCAAGMPPRQLTGPRAGPEFACSQAHFLPCHSNLPCFPGRAQRLEPLWRLGNLVKWGCPDGQAGVACCAG